jgi:hypothetical protein
MFSFCRTGREGDLLSFAEVLWSMQEARLFRFIGAYMVAEHLYNSMRHRFEDKAPYLRLFVPILLS